MDVISNICEFIEELNNHKDRTEEIYLDFLELIDVEIHVYGRNRENLIQIEDVQLRKEVRKFFTEVAIFLARIKINPDMYRINHSESIHNSITKDYHENEAKKHLSNAHTACDKLVQLAEKKENLIRRLKV